MTLDFSDYLFHSDDSTECDDDDDDENSEPNIVSNTGNGCHKDECACVKQNGNQPKGIWKDSGKPSSGYPCNGSKIAKSVDNDGNVRERDFSSKRPSAELTRSDEKVTSAQKTRDWKTGSLETLSWNDKVKHPSRKQLSLGGVEQNHASVRDLHKLLEMLKMKKSSPELMDPNTAPPMDGKPDDQDPDRVTRRQQPVYRSRRSLPGRLTDDHVTPAVHDTRKKNGRRGSVKFADEFGLNLNTFAMIPSRFSAQAHNDVNRKLHSNNNRKWNSDDRMSTSYIDRNTATDGFNGGMGSRWSLSNDFASDLGLFLKNGGDDDKTRRPEWDSHEFRSKAKSLGDDDLQDPSNHRRCSSEKRSSKQELETREAEVATREAEVATREAEVATREAEVNGRRHDFRLRFEQPFADLDGFQRKLRENFLCLENIRVDDRSSRNGDHDHGGTGPSRKRQGTTILCSIKVRHTDGGVGGGVTVFSRCTDNEWVTHADLPAQHLSGVSNLGFDYDTFCFAVRKPVQPSSREENEAASSAAGPTSAVEFALCCRVTEDGRTFSYWDNNDGANYRIEWFDD